MSLKDNETSAEVIDLGSLMNQEIGEAVVEPVNPLEEKKEDFLGLGKGDEGDDDTETEEEKTARLEADKSTDEQETEEEKEARLAADELANAGAIVEPNFYQKSAMELLGDDVTFTRENAEGEEEEVSVADTEIDQETYIALMKAKMEQIELDAKEGTVSVEGLTDLTREIVEIDRAGGDISTVLKSKETYIDVLDKLDLGEKADQRQAVAMRYRAGGNHSDEEIAILIKGFEDQGILEEKAEISDKEIRNAIATQIERTKEAALEERKKTDSLLKDYRKDLKTKLDVFDLKDTVKTKISKLATKKDDQGRFEIDNLYNKLKSNPETAAKVALFILDMKEYDKQVSSKVKKETQLKSANRISLVKKTSGSGSGSLKKGKKGGDDDSIILADLE